MNTITCTIEGTTALLQNRYKMAISPATGSVKKTARTGEPDWFSEWKDKLYLDQDGCISMPARPIEKSMERAAVQFKITGKRGKTYKELVGSMVFVSPSIIPFDGGIVPPQTTEAQALFESGLVYESNGDPMWRPRSGLFYIDLEPVVIQRARVVRSRPALAAGWRLSFDIVVRTDQLQLPTLQQILEYAGQNVGIGDFRPRFGQFRIVSFDEKK